MIAFGHTAVGALVGVSAYQMFGNGDLTTGLAVTTIAGVTSHYLFDLIPHGHFFNRGYKKNVNTVIIFDLFLSVLLFISTQYYFHGVDLAMLYLLFGIGASQAPDILDGLIYTDRIPNKGIIKIENNIHIATHWHGSGNNARLLGSSDIWQLAVVLIALFVVIKI